MNGKIYTFNGLTTDRLKKKCKYVFLNQRRRYYHFLVKNCTVVSSCSYRKEPKSVTASDLFTFFRADFVQSEASWKLSSTSDWLTSAWKNVN